MPAERVTHAAAFTGHWRTAVHSLRLDHIGEELRHGGGELFEAVFAKVLLPGEPRMKLPELLHVLLGQIVLPPVRIPALEAADVERCAPRRPSRGKQGRKARAQQHTKRIDARAR